MRKFFIGLAIVVVLLVASAAIIPTLVPSSVYKEKIQTQLSKELARDVSIKGDVKLSVFPSISAKTERVVIGNPAGFDGEVFAAMDGLNAKIKLLPLLSKRVEIKAFVLKNPVINLQKKADGTANWIIGSKADSPEPTPTEDTGPFKRDGRYATIDPAIGLFAIENGTVTYRDAATDTSYDLKEANLSLKLPSLSKPVNVKGDVIFGGEPLTLNVSLDTPRKFLNGDAAPVSAAIKTAFADIAAKGTFLASEAIAFDLNIEGDISDVAALAAYIPSGIPLASIAKTVSLKGNYIYDGVTFSAKGANISAKGPALDAAYTGDAVLADTPVLNGSVNVDVRDVPLLAGLLQQDMAGIDLAKTLTLSADMSAQGKGFSAKNVKAAMTGDGLDATFTGTAAFDGAVTANGDFSANTPSVPALVKALKLDIPQAAAAGNAGVKGKVNMKGDVMTLSGVSAVTQGGTATGRYYGDVTLGKTLAFNGTFESALSSLTEFAALTGTDVPYASAIGQIKASGTVSGQNDAIRLTDLDAALTDGQINGRYQGAASLKDGVTLDGMLTATIPSLRKLAATGGTELPPSTPTGDIYEAFSVSGAVKGTPGNIAFENADIALDHLNGGGRFDIDLSGTKPLLTGTLDLPGGLDLRPYMASYAAQNPTGKIQPWSEQPLNVSMMNTVDGNFKIYTKNIVTDRLKMGEANIDAALRSGKLTANIPKLNMYGGLGKLTATLDAAASKPEVTLNVAMDDLKTNAFLSAVAGFTNATGETNTGFSIKGSGLSQADIMKSLAGQGTFKVENGQLSGVDLQQLLSGLDTAITSRSLPSGIGADYATKFNNIAGLFTIENGIVNIGDFDLNGFGVAAKGGGQIDLGGQNIDFGLQPRLTDKNANDLASFGIPIRLKGGFGSVSAGLDTDMLGQIAASQAKARVQKELTERIGGSAGSLLGGILGGQTSTQSQGTTTPGATPTPPKTTQEDAVNNLLGGLLGTQKKQETDPNAQNTNPQDTEEQKKKDEEAAKKKEPSIEDTLFGILGQRDKD